MPVIVVARVSYTTLRDTTLKTRWQAYCRIPRAVGVHSGTGPGGTFLGSTPIILSPDMIQRRL